MLDRKLDDVTLGVFGDHDAGFGKTYAELIGDDDELDDAPMPVEDDWADFNFGKKKSK